jgi:DNA-binding transcriptional MerR regulator
MLKVSELEKLTGLSNSTVRRYIDKYLEYLPHTEIKGEYFFAEQTVNILLHISRLTGERKPPEFIREILLQDYGRTVEVVQEVQHQEISLPSTEVFGQVMQAIAQQGQMLQQMVQALDKTKEIAKLEDRLDRMDERNQKLDEVLRKLNEKKGLVQRVKEFLVGRE